MFDVGELPEGGRKISEIALVNIYRYYVNNFADKLLELIVISVTNLF